MTDPAAAADVGAEVIAARWRALSAGIDLPELTESWHPDAACRPGVAPKGVDWFASDRHGIAAALLITSGAVEIVERTRSTLLAEVEGRTGTRRHVTHADGRWLCDCPAFRYRHRCAHLDAVKLVAAEPGYRRLRPDGCPSDRINCRNPNASKRLDRATGDYRDLPADGTRTQLDAAQCDICGYAEPKHLSWCHQAETPSPASTGASLPDDNGRRLRGIREARLTLRNDADEVTS